MAMPLAGCSGSVRRLQFRAKICEAIRPTPAAFKELPPSQFNATDGWKTAEPGDDMIRGQWWEVFHDPELNAFESQVAGSNQSVAAALANFLAARAVVKQARSQYFPTIAPILRSSTHDNRPCPLRRRPRPAPNTRCPLTPRGSRIYGAASATP